MMILSMRRRSSVISAGISLAATGLLLWATAPAGGQQAEGRAGAAAAPAAPKAEQPGAPAEGGQVRRRVATVPLCSYPRHATRRPAPSQRLGLSIAAQEREPNDTPASAQAVPLGFGVGQDVDVDISGTIAADDIDVFSFEASKGDVLGVASLARQLDSVVALLDSNGNPILANDQHGGLASLYPPNSPLPAGGEGNDAAFSFVFPAPGRYFIQLEPFGSTTGRYQLQMRLRKPAMRSQPERTRQIIFLDFDGATGLNALATFGQGRPSADLSPMSSFLPGWGLAAGDQGRLIDGIVRKITEHFEQLRSAGGNPDFDFEIRNSKDHPDTFGQPNVARVILGGTINQLGISTIGIAQFVDPGNFSSTDTAVVLLDLLSAPAPDPNSVNSIRTAAGMEKVEAVARVVAAVTSHEMGHFLGCWHTANDNSVVCLMDQGGDLLNTAGVGPDRILGSSDDVPDLFVTDAYADEGIAEPPHRENTQVRVAFALSVGKLTQEAAIATLERDFFQAQLARQRDALTETRTSSVPVLESPSPAANIRIPGVEMNAADAPPLDAGGMEWLFAPEERGSTANSRSWEKRMEALRAQIRAIRASR